MTLTMKRYVLPLAAAAVLGAVLPAAPGAADEARPFSGYTATATAAPVTIEIYEPTIPIPADPQFELVLGYSTVEADSGSSMGRASWLWPGDSVGEGLKTFVEQLGLPPQLGENGYPVQVNASQPSGEDAQRDEPFPGTVMRTSAGEDTTVAQVGFSPDAQVQDGDAPAESEDAGPVPGLPLDTGLLTSFGQAITGSAPAAEQEEPAPGTTPGLPPELAALVDVEGYTSSSKTVADKGSITSIARSALGDVSLLGGLVVLEGVTSVSRSVSDGKQASGTEQARIGGITVAGQTFAFGPAGFEAAGQQQALPDLPPELTAALARLGLTLTLPEPERTQDGDQTSSEVAGLRIEIDAKTLKKQLSALPLDALVGAFPSDPPQLKSALQALTGLAPKIVVTLGTASTEVDTVQGIAIPELPTVDPGEDGSTPGTGAPSGDDSGGGAVPTGGTPAASSPTAATADDSTPDAAAAAADLPAAELTGSGLPPLYSLPGALLVAGIALAAVGGTWLRKIGVIALGGAGSCSHGLDSGLPDLRKAPR